MKYHQFDVGSDLKQRFSKFLPRRLCQTDGTTALEVIALAQSTPPWRLHGMFLDDLSSRRLSLYLKAIKLHSD